MLYFVDEGHGPVVRAANEAFGTTFDVPSDRLDGTALSEALLVAGIDEVDAETVSELAEEAASMGTFRSLVHTAGLAVQYVIQTKIRPAIGRVRRRTGN